MSGNHELTGANASTLRVLLYSHDSVGLGHLRRNLAIAGKINEAFPSSNVLILTGSSCATQFQVPDNTDLIKLPSVTKDESGAYVTGCFGGSVDDTLKFRSQLLVQTCMAFSPHLVIVDHQLIGLGGEALPMLREAKRQGAVLFFGMRDVKDGPETVKRAWDCPQCRWALEAGYDQICIYGEQAVFDPIQAYAPLLDRVRHCEFTGYIVPQTQNRQGRSEQDNLTRKNVVVTFGGGVDGHQRLLQYLTGLQNHQADWDSLIVTGPMMPQSKFREYKALASRIQPQGSVRIKRFHSNLPGLFRKADAILSMAGYNSCVEIIQSGTPAVLMPRVFPRQEQLIRAQRLAELGLVRVITDESPDPEHLINEVEAALSTPLQVKRPLRLNGLDNLCRLMRVHLQASGYSQKSRVAADERDNFRLQLDQQIA